MRRCTSQTGNSPLWYSTSRTPNSVVPRPKRAMLAREWRSTASNARASTTHSMSPVSPGTVVLCAIFRRNLGLVFLAHGTQKAFGAFGGPGFAGATGFIGSLGFRPARLWAALAVGGELAAGLLYLLGLLTPLASLLVLGTMAVAIAKVHGPKGFFMQNGGYEYNLVLIIAALTLALAGPGAFSLDHLLGFAR